MKRKKRRAIGDKYHLILTEHFSSMQSLDKSTVTKQSDSQFRNQNIIGSKFTDTIDDFYRTLKQLISFNFLYNISFNAIFNHHIKIKIQINTNKTFNSTLQYLFI